MTRKPVIRRTLAHELDGALSECELAVLDPAEFHKEYDAKQANMIARRKFIQDGLGLEERSAPSLRLSETSLPGLSRWMDNTDLLVAQGGLGVSYPRPGQIDKSLRGDLGTVRPEMLSANTGIANLEKFAFAWPNVPVNRSNFLIADTSRIEENTTILKRKRGLDIREGSCLLAKKPADLEDAAIMVGKTISHGSPATIHSRLNRCLGRSSLFLENSEIG